MESLTVGMRLDELPVNQIPGSWRYAKNMSAFARGKAISVEDGADDITPTIGGAGTTAYPVNKQCIGVIELNEDRILFFATTSASDSEIGRIKSDGKYYPIIKDAVLNFNRNFPIQGTFQNKFNNNVIISWIDNNTSPKILNIDCIPFRINPTTFAINPLDITKAEVLLALFSPFKTPVVDEYNLDVVEGQGALMSGAYYPIVSYESLDGTTTSWAKVYNGVPIFASSINGNHKDISGGYGGEGTGKAITIGFVNVDTNYKKLRVGYLYVSNGIVVPYYERSVIINSDAVTVILTGASKIQLDINEVLIPNSVFTKAKTITSLQKSLYLGGVEEPSDFNYQTYANQIAIHWNRTIEVSINGTARTGGSGFGTYQNPKQVFSVKGFKSGECYALYIVLKYKDGRYSKAFHIPGRVTIAGDKDVMNGIPEYNALGNGNSVYRYQVNNTNTNISATRGLMGYWENENEEYPLDPNNPSAVHPDFATVPGITISDRKVRHHVFPDLSNMYGSIPAQTTSGERFVDGTFIGGGGSYPVEDLTSKVFAIEVSNVNIPVALLPFVDSWEIHYAERNNANIRILGTDCASSDSSAGGFTFGKFQLFDLMVSKPSIVPFYLKPVWKYINAVESGQQGNFVEAIASSERATVGTPGISNISEFYYLGENVTIPHNNAGKAENISIKYKPAIAQSFSISTTGVSQDVVLIDVCIFRRNTYLNFSSQTLISTGIGKRINSSGVQPQTIILGGDVYINRHSFNPLNTGTDAVSIVVESASNIGLRTEDFALNKFFAPKYNNPSPSWYGYNTDYNCINKFNQIDIYYPADNCTSQDITVHKYRIPFSVFEGTENSSINWRIFKANSYYEMPNNKGEIWNLLGSNKTLYIHMKYSLFIAEIKDSLRFGDNDIAALGVTDIFDRPPTEALTVSEGFAGTQSQFACILCKLGYCFIDRQEGKVFVVPPGQTRPIELSDFGMFNFFKEFSETSNELVDNPFLGMGYTMGYNNSYNTLILCKQDTPGYNFTISFSPDLNEGKGGWISFHDYRPNYISYNRNGFLGIENGLFKVWKHNSVLVKSRYYDGITKDSYIDVVFNQSPQQSKRFDNVNWITTVEDSGVTYKNETVSHLIVYNDTQCSGKIALSSNPGLWFSNDVRNSEDTWNYNNFRDLTSNRTLPFIDNKGELIGSNINNNKPWFEKSKFVSKFVIFRLINDNLSQKNLHISMVGSNIKKSDR